MVRHWWKERKTEKGWIHKLFVNGIGLIITLFILFSVVAIKFREGGWITIIITSTLILIISSIKRHYNYADKLIKRLDVKMLNFVDEVFSHAPVTREPEIPDPNAKTAVICVSSFNGLGICTFMKVKEEFQEYQNIVFLEIGIVDSANFRGNDELSKLHSSIRKDLENYSKLAGGYGYHTECLLNHIWLPALQKLLVRKACISFGSCDYNTDICFFIQGSQNNFDLVSWSLK